MLLSMNSGLRVLLGVSLGVVAGSFVATLVLRWPADRSVAAGRSSCDGCGTTLQAPELVPLLSFLAQRGRCRRCCARINLHHPIIELAGGVIGLLAMLLHPGWDGAAGALFGWMLLALAALDIDHLWLPDRLTLPLLALGLITGAAGLASALVDRAIGAAAGYAVLVVVAWSYRKLRRREGIGGGDPKLLAALGAWVGWHALPTVLLTASMLGLVTVLTLRLAGRQMAATRQLPLGAFLAMAAWTVWLADEVPWLA